MKYKKLIAILVSFTLLFVSALPAFSMDKNTKPGKNAFKDIGDDHWAKDAINWMSEKKIISGYPGGEFKPNNPVLRGEFAKLMVTALEIPLIMPENSVFSDIRKDSWLYSFVESAKTYLTGYKTSDGTYYFKPGEVAVREDMAVALVKALKLENEPANDEVLNAFSDNDKISKNLRKYVAIAVSKGIMKGYELDGGQTKLFRPEATLTRAEAAMLLFKAIGGEEKITFDDEKVVIGDKKPSGDKNSEDELKDNDDENENNIDENSDENNNENDEDSQYIAPMVTDEVYDGAITLKWDKIESEELQGYKVVISKNNSTPEYPDDGYLYWITDRNKTTAVINNREPYKNGDFGKYLTPGEKYYFSVTAVYGDRKVPGNVLEIVYPVDAKAGNVNQKPVKAYKVPMVKSEIKDGVLVLSWTPINDERFQGYKVVASKSNSKPKYPDDGYLYWITDKNTSSAVIDNSSAYNGGDIEGGYFVPGETYYFSVTALYNDVKVPGNVLTVTFPEGASNQDEENN